MRRIVLAKNEIFQSAVAVDDRERVELMLPDNIVCKLERCSLRRGNETLERSHKRCDLLIKAHARHAVVTARNNTEQLAAFSVLDEME